VPASLKLQQQYGDDLQVLFVESQGADLATAEAFAWRMKWMGAGAMWTTEAPVQVEGNTLPKFALLDAQGRLLLKGNPMGMKKQIEEAIAAEVRNAKSAPEGTPAKLAKGWSSFVKGEVGAALAECDKAAADAALSDAAKALRAEIVARTNARVARGKWLIDNGYVDEGTELLTKLGKAVKGCADFDDAVAKELARVAAPDKGFAHEVEAAKALGAVRQRMLKDKPFDDGNVKALARVADKYKGTKAGERAAHLVELSKVESR
jgi:hypothetical protein